MRSNFDFSSLFRSSIGFDRMLNALETANSVDNIETWPPYDIVKLGDDDYRITIAVAGFSSSDLTISQEHNMLLVTGQKANKDKDNVQYLHRGIAGRAFRRRFELADYVRVEDAHLTNGLLTINLKRELPEEMKPRRIEILTGDAASCAEMKQIEVEKQAA